MAICGRLLCHSDTLLLIRLSIKDASTFFPFHPEGDPGQRAGHAQDAGGNGEVQGRASAPSGGRGEPAGLLQSGAAAEGPGRAGAPHGAAGQAAGGSTQSKSFSCT